MGALSKAKKRTEKVDTQIEYILIKLKNYLY